MWFHAEVVKMRVVGVFSTLQIDVCSNFIVSYVLQLLCGLRPADPLQGLCPLTPPDPL